MLWQRFWVRFFLKSFLPYLVFSALYTWYILTVFNPGTNGKENLKTEGFVILPASLLYCTYKLYHEIKEVKTTGEFYFKGTSFFWNLI